MPYSYNDPDPAKESFEYLTELMMEHTALAEDQCRKIARALLSFADVLVDE